ncbi:hypothetical protein FKM82_005309 [Ascaphus truei]
MNLHSIMSVLTRFPFLQCFSCTAWGLFLMLTTGGICHTSIFSYDYQVSRFFLVFFLLLFKPFSCFVLCTLKFQDSSGGFRCADVTRRARWRQAVERAGVARQHHA